MKSAKQGIATDRGSDTKHIGAVNPNPKLVKTDDLAIDDILSPSYWESINPHLSATETAAHPTIGAPLGGGGGLSNGAKISKSYVRDGFVEVKFPNDNEAHQARVEALAKGVENLVLHGWPAIFIYVYREAYEMIREWQPTLHALNGGSIFLGDVYAWKIDPESNQSGWAPHRDRMGSKKDSFRSNGTARLSTSWLALTNATTNNSCMAFIPAPYDPNYWTGEEDKDILGEIFADTKVFQRIRSKPIRQGKLLHFSHRVIHWGTACDCDLDEHEGEGEEKEGPRIAMNWVTGDPTYEQPALKTSFPTTLQEKVAFCSSQLIGYTVQTGNLSKSDKYLYWRLFSSSKSYFNQWYYDKIANLYWLYYKKNDKVQMKVRKAPVGETGEGKGGTAKHGSSDESKGGEVDFTGIGDLFA